jgi:hypothetical protein
MVTLALGTAAPDGSVIVPTMVASWPNAWNEPANSMTQSAASQMPQPFALEVRLSMHANRLFTANLLDEISTHRIDPRTLPQSLPVRSPFIPGDCALSRTIDNL